MDADTHCVKSSEHDFSDDLGSKIGNTLNGVLHIKDVQPEKYASNNMDGSEKRANALENVSSLSDSLQVFIYLIAFGEVNCNYPGGSCVKTSN